MSSRWTSPRAPWPSPGRMRAPRGALLAGPDGLAMIRPLVADAGLYLKPGGRLWLEIGESQGEAVRRLPCGNLRFLGIEKDLAGRDRVARWIMIAGEDRGGGEGREGSGSEKAWT